MKLAEHLAQRLCERAAADPSLFVLDGDLADSNGAYQFAERFPDRFLMAGIAEQNLVGVAAGLASTGRKPWAFSFAAFLIYRAYDQIRIGLAQSYQPVVLVGSHAGGLAARNGKSHATLNDIALMTTLGHVEVYAPGDANDVAWLTDALVDRPRAAYIRLPRADNLPPLPGAAGAIRWLAPRAATTIVSTGLASHWAVAVADTLAIRGRAIGVLHVPQLKPLPNLSAALDQVADIVTLEDHVTLGGLGSLLQDRFPGRTIRKLGWPVEFAGTSGDDDAIRRSFALDLDGLVDAMEQIARDPSRC